jgi:2'-5' RNA ligase
MSVVVALFEPLSVGATFSRRQWPAHVTLASNFVVSEPVEAVVRVVRSICDAEAPLSLTFAGEAVFGPRNVHVQLVDSDQIVTMHDRLADAFEGMPGFAAESPAFWRAGYRPHMTHVPDLVLREGDTVRLPHVAVADLIESTATIIATSSLA